MHKSEYTDIAIANVAATYGAAVCVDGAADVHFLAMNV